MCCVHCYGKKRKKGLDKNEVLDGKWDGVFELKSRCFGRRNLVLGNRSWIAVIGAFWETIAKKYKQKKRKNVVVVAVRFLLCSWLWVWFCFPFQNSLERRFCVWAASMELKFFYGWQQYRNKTQGPWHVVWKREDIISPKIRVFSKLLQKAKNK